MLFYQLQWTASNIRRERPSSEELCQKLAGLKDSQNYRDNVRQHQDEIQAKDRELEEKDKVIASRERQLRQLNQQLEEQEQVTGEIQHSLQKQVEQLQH